MTSKMPPLFINYGVPTPLPKANRKGTSKIAGGYLAGLHERSKDVLAGFDWLSMVSTVDYFHANKDFFTLPNDTNSSSKTFYDVDFPTNATYFDSDPNAPVQVSQFYSGDKFIESYSLQCIKDDAKEKQFFISCVFEGVSYNIVRFSFYKESSIQYINNQHRTRIDFYGKYFRLEALGMLPPPHIFFVNFHGDPTNFHITRADYRIDFFGLPDGMPSVKKMSRHKIRTSVANYTKGDVTTGRQRGRKNHKSVFVRCYDKKEEAKKHKDNVLYADYIRYQGDIWRLEFEFGANFLVNRTKDKKSTPIYFDKEGLDILRQKIEQYLGFADKTLFFSGAYNMKLTLDDYTPDQKDRLAKRLVTGLKKYHEKGISVTHFLREAGLTEYEILQDLKKHSNDPGKLPDMLSLAQ